MGMTSDLEAGWGVTVVVMMLRAQVAPAQHLRLPRPTPLSQMRNREAFGLPAQGSTASKGPETRPSGGQPLQAHRFPRVHLRGNL